MLIDRGLRTKRHLPMVDLCPSAWNRQLHSALVLANRHNLRNTALILNRSPASLVSSPEAIPCPVRLGAYSTRASFEPRAGRNADLGL